MKKIVSATLALLLLLTGCTLSTPMTEPAESYAYGVYEFTFSIEQLSDGNTDQWDFIYIYNGEIISSGHRIVYSLELFTFHTIHVEISERGVPTNKYNASFRVAICDKGSGKTEVSVIDTDGISSRWRIICNVSQVGK